MHVIKLNREIDSWGYARYLLEYELSQAPEGEPIELQVDSLGGDVMEAITISNMLHDHGNVTAHIVGFCASAATWLCYGCDRVVINDDCAFLIHKCAAYIDAWGYMTAEELDQLIDKLKSEKKSNDAIDLIIANKYAKHSAGKLDIKAALKLMQENRWMLPEEALSLGLVDEVLEDHVMAKTNIAARMHVMNSMADMPRLPEKFQPLSAAASPAAGAAAGAAAGEIEQKAQEYTFLGALKKVLTDFFGGAVKAVDNRQCEIVEEETQTLFSMNEEYTTVNQLLQADGLEENEGRIMLTAEQMQTINARLTEAADLDSQVTSLTGERDQARTDLQDALSRIDSLSDDIAAIDTIEGKVNAIRELLDRATGNDTHALLEGNGHDGAASDPINQVASAYIRK